MKTCRTCQIPKELEFFSEQRGSVALDCKECKSRKVAKYAQESLKSVERKFGISKETYIELRESQNNVCAICHKPPSQTNKKYSRKNLSVDHDHITGNIRGLLCVKCNILLGQANDNPQILQSAIDYLQKFSKKILANTQN